MRIILVMGLAFASLIALPASAQDAPAQAQAAPIDYDRIAKMLASAIRASGDITAAELRPHLVSIEQKMEQMQPQAPASGDEPEELDAVEPEETLQPQSGLQDEALPVVQAQYQNQYLGQYEPGYTPPGFGRPNVGFGIQGNMRVGVGFNQRQPYRPHYRARRPVGAALRGTPNCRKYPGFHIAPSGRCERTRPATAAMVSQYARPGSNECNRQGQRLPDVVVPLPGGGIRTIRMECRRDR